MFFKENPPTLVAEETLKEAFLTISAPSRSYLTFFYDSGISFIGAVSSAFCAYLYSMPSFLVWGFPPFIIAGIFVALGLLVGSGLMFYFHKRDSQRKQEFLITHKNEVTQTMGEVSSQIANKFLFIIQAKEEHAVFLDKKCTKDRNELQEQISQSKKDKNDCIVALEEQYQKKERELEERLKSAEKTISSQQKAISDSLQKISTLLQPETSTKPTLTDVRLGTTVVTTPILNLLSDIQAAITPKQATDYQDISPTVLDFNSPNA